MSTRSAEAATIAPQSAGLVALADRIELWPIDRLRPYERNPRTHSDAQVDQIAASMVEFGWTNPILVDENAGILAGHGRLLAARKLGLAEVPVIQFEHLTEAQKRAYLIADNQLALRRAGARSCWRQELAGYGRGFDLDLIGFDAASWSGCWRAEGRAGLDRGRRRAGAAGAGGHASRATSGCWASTGCCAATPRSWPMSSGCSAGSSPT